MAATPAKLFVRITRPHVHELQLHYCCRCLVIIVPDMTRGTNRLSLCLQGGSGSCTPNGSGIVPLSGCIRIGICGSAAGTAAARAGQQCGSKLHGRRSLAHCSRRRWHSPGVALGGSPNAPPPPPHVPAYACASMSCQLHQHPPFDIDRLCNAIKTQSFETIIFRRGEPSCLSGSKDNLLHVSRSTDLFYLWLCTLKQIIVPSATSQ